MNFLNSKFEKLSISKLRSFVNKAKGNFINMGLGEIGFSMNSYVKNEVKKIIDTKRIVYTPNSGLDKLNELIKVDYSYSADVCVTCGAEEAVFATLFAIINPQDEILLPNPTYLAYETIIKICGGKVKYFDLEKNNSFAINRKSLENSISKNTKAILFANPSNPLGISFSKSEIEFIKDIAEENNLLIIADEIYKELYLDKPIPGFFEKNKENIVIISGISKAFAMAGWRLGWVVSPNKRLIEGITVAHQYISTCAPTISQYLAIKLLENKTTLVNEIRSRLKYSYDFFYNSLKTELPNAKFLSYKVAPYLFVGFDFDDVKIAEDLLMRGLLVIPGSFFGTNGKFWIRMNYALDLEKLVRAKKIIVNYFNK